MNSFCGIEIMSVLFLLIILVNILTKWKKSDSVLKIFALNAVIIVLSCISELIYLIGFHDENNLFYLIPFLFGSCASASGWWYYTFVINNEGKEEIIKSALPKIFTIAMLVCMLIAIISYARGTFYFVSEPNLSGEATIEYGPSLLLIYLLHLLSIIIMCVLTFLKRKQIKKRTQVLALLPIILSMLGVGGEALFPGSVLSLPAGSIGLFLQYLLLESHIVSDTKMREKIMLEMANTDVLTGLPNRRSYISFLDENSETIDAGAIFIDINNLKRTNDTFGHFEGDKLIISCANLLKKSLAGSKLFRISGDEFVAIYLGENAQQLFDSEKVAVRSVLKEHDSIASMGATWGNKSDLNTTIHIAEDYMYQDKSEYYKTTGIERRK